MKDFKTPLKTKDSKEGRRMMRIALRLMRPPLAGCGTAAQAHRFHMGITDISYNERTGSTEIVHTYMAHDLEALLTESVRRQFDLASRTDEAPCCASTSKSSSG
jgi:uncharacterized protein (DUF2267 family)